MTNLFSFRQHSICVKQPLIATFVSSPVEITRLDSFVRTLTADPEMLGPKFFLGSVSPHGWKPLVVVASDGKRVAGLIYCKERVVAGLGTRVAFGDDSLGAMVAAHPVDRDAVIRCGISALLQRMVALRFVVSPDWLRLLTDLQAVSDVSFFDAKPHAQLQLPIRYDAFLAKLGPRTRRNFRYYRRKSERAANEFSSTLTFRDFVSVAKGLLPNADYATSRSKRTLDRHLAMIESMPSRMLMGLRTTGGEWIGLAGGWYVGDRAVLVMQLNNRTYRRDSVSVVLRSYLIEFLIKRGVQELVFWGDSSAPLCFYTVYPDVLMMKLDRRVPLWRFGRWVWARVRHFAPTAFGKLLTYCVRDA